MYEYDEEGRVARTVSQSEPEWNDDDRADMEALAALESDECSGCGHPLSETTTSNFYEDYEVPAPRRCQACTAVMVKQTLLDAQKPEHPGALRWQVSKKGGA